MSSVIYSGEMVPKESGSSSFIRRVNPGVTSEVVISVDEIGGMAKRRELEAITYSALFIAALFIRVCGGNIIQRMMRALSGLDGA